MIAGTVLTATPIFGAGASVGPKVQQQEDIPQSPFSTKAYGTTDAQSPLKPMTIERRAVGEHDVLIGIEYCGICHSDIHTARDEWKDIGMPTLYPAVLGHEVIGKVIAVGSKVTKFKVGDAAGVGCMVDACLGCENCEDDREQNCKDVAFIYNSPDKISGGHTYGGYSDKIVVKEHFAIRIPPGVDHAAMAPLLCAGITTFSPIRHWDVSKNQKVGVIGLGGLGHIAVKLAVAHKAEVTVFTTTPDKIADAKRMGAKDTVLWSDEQKMQELNGYFDFMISTVPKAYPMQAFVNLLKLDATLVNVGAMEDIQGVSGLGLVFGRKNISGSLIGGIAETQEVIDFCAARGIKADIELIDAKDINTAYDNVVDKKVRYRYVIDMKTL
ncbi:MAG: NAD(P)-dependent alcohol dehydrogenase [Labilibaculum sp.]|nr:NAD(P)-dependent alcohol dehydrogenase [Labilibaculum sp.]